MAFLYKWRPPTIQTISYMETQESLSLTSASGAIEQIETLQSQIAQLKHRAVLELKVKIGEAKAQVAGLEAQLEKMTKDLGTSMPVERTRKPRGKATIDAIVHSIRGGAYNYRMVAKELNVSAATVTKMIKQGGTAAGITSSGQKGAFRLKA